MVTVGRRYVSLVLLILVVSTAATYAMWLLRKGDPVELLILEAPETLFASVQLPRTVSIAVSPQKDLESLEFRFRCLLERPLPRQLLNLDPGADTTALLQACPAIRGRLEYLQSIGAGDFAVVREAELTGKDDLVVLFVDFANVMSVLLEGDQSNQSHTTFAVILNRTRHPLAYFEGYAELFTAGEHLLELVTIESKGTTTEYHSSPKEGQHSLADLEIEYGIVEIGKAQKGEVDGVTLVLKKRKTGIPGGIYQVKVAAPSYLETIETYVEGRYVRGASAYWQIFHGDAPEEE